MASSELEDKQGLGGVASSHNTVTFTPDSKKPHATAGMSEGPGSDPVKTLLLSGKCLVRDETGPEKRGGTSTVIGGNVCIPRSLATGCGGQLARD